MIKCLTRHRIEFIIINLWFYGILNEFDTESVLFIYYIQHLFYNSQLSERLNECVNTDKHIVREYTHINNMFLLYLFHTIFHFFFLFFFTYYVKWLCFQEALQAQIELKYEIKKIWQSL